jgi:hypothetical protein
MSGLPFNALDHSGDVSVDRRSSMGSYDVVDHMPRYVRTDQYISLMDGWQKPNWSHRLCGPRNAASLGSQPLR